MLKNVDILDDMAMDAPEHARDIIIATAKALKAFDKVVHESQGHSMRIFVRKMPQRCGVWQIKPMASLDQDPLSTKSNSSGFGSYSQMKF